MRKLVISGVAVALVAGCSSPAPNPAGVCHDVAERVGALARIGPEDTRATIVPLLDAQLDIARRARADLGSIPVEPKGRQAYDAMLTRWDGTVVVMQRLRDTWQDPTGGRPTRPYEDVVLALGLAAAADDLTKAVDGLNAAAAAAAPTCGTIPWRGGS